MQKTVKLLKRAGIFILIILLILEVIEVISLKQIIINGFNHFTKNKNEAMSFESKPMFKNVVLKKTTILNKPARVKRKPISATSSGYALNTKIKKYGLKMGPAIFFDCYRYQPKTGHKVTPIDEKNNWLKISFNYQGRNRSGWVEKEAVTNHLSAVGEIDKNKFPNG